MTTPQLDSVGGTTVAQQESALRLLVKPARIWWQSIFPPEVKKTKKAGKGKGKKKGKKTKAKAKKTA
jgi:hypothetical protein